MADSKFICIGCSICATIIILIIFLLSIGTIEPIEYGIVYNSITKKVDTENVYQGGWYLIGPVSSFYTFPSTLVNMDFTEFPDAKSKPLLVKDNDGQEIKLSFSIQYQLNRDDIGKLYAEFQKGYETTFVSYIDSVVRKVVGEFDSNAFWIDRQASGNKLRVAIDAKLQEVYTRCKHL